MDSEQNGSKQPTPLEEKSLNPREVDFINAKSYLLNQSTDSGVNLYDHLVVCLKQILEEHPSNIFDEFECLSKEVKRSKFASRCDTIQNKCERSTEAALAEAQINLFAKVQEKPHGKEDEDDELEPSLPNLLQTAFFFEQAGIGLNREETLRVWLALKQLVDTYPLERVRFWGKMYGTQKNYYVAEVEFREGEDAELPVEAPPGSAASEKRAASEAKSDKLEGEDEEGEEEIKDEPPKPDWKPAPEAPIEENRTGVNKKVYFVCNEPGRPWVRLPLATPAQIFAARKVSKFLTGDLEAPVFAYPPFPGNEANFLRAQITRISAGTQVSPLGFYQFDEEEEEEEEEGGVRENFMENPEFEGIPVRELADPSMANWVHHVLHILPQGRCRWWNPSQKRDDEFEDEEDEDEEKEEPDEPEPETGPPLLTPLSEDLEIENMPAWTAKISSNLVPQYAVSVVSSNLWPGAHAFAYAKTFENVYIGWGNKYSPENFSPLPPTPAQMEYPSGQEITEIDDPTPEEEAALKAAQAEAEKEGEEGEEEMEEEEEDDD